MRVRSLLLVVLAIAGVTSTSGCVVAESMVLTTHMRHYAATPDNDPGEIRAATPKESPARRTVDVPAETEPTP